MIYFFQFLPKIVFYPVYVTGWCGILLCILVAVRKLRLSGGKDGKSLLPFGFVAVVLLLGIFPIQSARYVFMLAFPFTFFAAAFLISAADCFGKRPVVLLTVFALAVTIGNTLKILHTDSTSRFAQQAAKELRGCFAGVPRDEILLLGTSRDLGRIAHNAGVAYRDYPYPIEDGLDLALLKEHFCDRYQTLILIFAEREVKNTPLPAPLFRIKKKNNYIHFYKPDLSAANLSLIAKTGSNNLFLNADFTQPMSPNSMERMKTYFKNNPEVLKIVTRPDFIWPYAWPFDHAGKYFPERDFDLKLDKTPRGEKAIHLQSHTELPFFHSVAFPMDKNYLLSLKIRLLEDSDLSIRQLLKLNNGKVFVEEIKAIAGKTGREQIFQIPVCPGQRMRFSETERKQGCFYLFFVLQHGNVQFSTFTLQEIEG